MPIGREGNTILTCVVRIVHAIGGETGLQFRRPTKTAHRRVRGHTAHVGLVMSYAAYLPPCLVLSVGHWHIRLRGFMGR